MSTIEIANIPVHAESVEKWLVERDQTVEKRVLDSGIQVIRGDPEVLVRRTRDSVYDDWGGWRYNRVVAWLCVIAEDGTLRVDVHRHASGRFSRQPALRYVVYEYRADAIGLGAVQGVNLPEWLVTTVRQIIASGFKTRWVDWRSIEIVAQATDWLAIMRQSVGRSDGGGRAGPA